MNRRIQFGSGGHILEGWENYDMDMRIDEPLPIPDLSCKFLCASHVVEHVTPQKAWSFLLECHRILVPSGVVRISVPDIARIWKLADANYMRVAQCFDKKHCVQAAIWNHGHQGAWSAELLETVMQAIGFTTERCSYGESKHVELHGIDGHGRVVGDDVARIETSVIEGTK